MYLMSQVSSYTMKRGKIGMALQGSQTQLPISNKAYLKIACSLHGVMSLMILSNWAVPSPCTHSGLAFPKDKTRNLYKLKA